MKRKSLLLYFLFTTLSIQSFGQVNSSFSISTGSGCIDALVTFTDLSTGPVVNWVWDFGDGNSSVLPSPTHTYESSGLYTITLTVDDGAGDFDSFSQFYTVNPPTADFTLSPKVGCAIPHTVFFTDLSTLPDTWLWDFGDGNTSTLQNPIHNYTTAGEFIVTLTVTDTTNGCTNATSDTVNVIVTNADFTTSPQFGCGPLTANFTDASTVLSSSIESWSWDLDDGVTSSAQDTTYTYNTPGIYNITLTITDTNGCTSTESKPAWVQVIGPDVNFGSDTTGAECAPLTVNFTDSTIFGAPIISWDWDFGDGSSSNLQNPTYTYTTTGCYDVSLTVTDIDGCSRTFTIDSMICFNDAVPPSFDVCPTDLNVDFDGACEYTLIDYTGLATVSDNCSGTPTVTQSPAAGTVITTTQTITLTATDELGNTANCTFDVIPSDNTNPTISCPPNQDVDFSASCDYTLLDYTGLGVTSDNCGGVTVTQSPVAGTVITTTQTITLTATDGAGNTASCTFAVIPSDNTNPTITCPVDQNVDFSADCDYTLIDFTGLASTTDNCGGTTVSQSPAIGTIITTSQTITLTATDGAGNTASCTFDVLPADITAPSISCPADMTIPNTTASCGATVSYGTVVGTDNCSGATTTLTAGLADGSFFPFGTTTVSYEVTDGTGLTASCSFDITVTDDEAPVITCPIDITQDNDPGECGAIIGFSDPIFSDNCIGSLLNQTAGSASGTLFPIGTTTNSFEVTDASGNTANCSFDITIIDVELPSIECPNSFESCDSVLNFNDPITTDNCSGESWSLISGIESGGTFPVGITTNTIEITDASGNVSSCSFDIARLILPTVNAGPDQSIDAGTTALIDATSTNADIFDWSPTEGLDNPTIEDPMASPQFPTTYTLIVTSTDGCETSDEVEILVETEVEANNFMSPNGDGKNDTWIIKGNYLLDGCTVEIYDSWGNKVFESEGYSNDWDGTKGDKQLSAGAFYYVISCEGQEQLTGSITLIR